MKIYMRSCDTKRAGGSLGKSSELACTVGKIQRRLDNSNVTYEIYIECEGTTKHGDGSRGGKPKSIRRNASITFSAKEISRILTYALQNDIVSLTADPMPLAADKVASMDMFKNGYLTALHNSIKVGSDTRRQDL